ncbi:hypothetical protein L1887_59224 [Cichorium endivia]|nr:hypothetical protein L1887_59224 [Cichorium endivia]
MVKRVRVGAHRERLLGRLTGASSYCAATRTPGAGEIVEQIIPLTRLSGHVACQRHEHGHRQEEPRWWLRAVFVEGDERERGQRKGKQRISCEVAKLVHSLSSFAIGAAGCCCNWLITASKL